MKSRKDWRRRYSRVQARPRRPWYLSPGTFSLTLVLFGSLGLALFLTDLDRLVPSAVSATPDPTWRPTTIAVAPTAAPATRPTTSPPILTLSVVPIGDEQLRLAALGPFQGLDGRFGIAVKDLGSGQAAYLNETSLFRAASLFKLPVMYEVFRQRALERLTLQEDLTISADDAAYDLGTLGWPAGTVITLGTALERMITVSDNSSAFMLTRRVGGSARINEDLLALGLPQTVVRADELATSPRDMLRLLELLAEGRAVNNGSSAEMVQLMTRGRIRDRIPSLLPPDTVVANKTGNWERAVHDVALLYAPKATLALAFLADDVENFGAVYAAMGRAARNLYDLTNAPGFPAGPRPLAPPPGSGYSVPPRLPTPTATPTLTPTHTETPAELEQQESATPEPTPTSTPRPSPRPTPRERPTAATPTATPTILPVATPRSAVQRP